MATPVFEKVPSELDFPKEERETLAFWKSEKIFEKSLSHRDNAETFVFYEGPPTANGIPHNGHVLTRVVKDIFPRYKTMRGYRVPRKAGWDTHGLPVEVEVEKELRIHGKAAIEEYGVEPFVKRCIDSVFRYTNAWESLTERVGFWVSLEDAYVTYHKSYVESVWWALSELFKKGLLYQGHKVVWWWAQGGTALSAGEVGQGYKTVDDPSVFVAFPLKAPIGGETAELLVWTTTPWTLPSNMYAAVNPKFEYALVKTKEGRNFVVAKGLVEGLTKKLGGELTVLQSLSGADLEGREYTPPFDVYAGLQKQVAMADGRTLPAYNRIIAADFVTLDAGTGIVHIAPAFGEDDHVAFRKEQERLADRGSLELFCAVKPDGTFKDELPRYKGRWVKECDKEISQELKERHLLVHAEQYRHDYPFCWRADSDPLIQFARPAWYIRTTEKIDRAIENNRAVQWFPDHIKEGRFGDFLANNVDWALSRERFWGTPLNIWTCTCGHLEAPCSVAEIEAKNPRAFDHFRESKKADPTLSDHLIVHKPWIDHVTFPCPSCGATMTRVKDVIDCWFDSGCMPFAQWGFPHQGAEKFKESFPADFISEAIDQTRGWFYSLLMISTLVFDEETQARYGLSPVRGYPHPYETCIVLGHVCDKEGKKESKSKGNYTPPEVIFDSVRMEFGVLDTKDAGGQEAKPGVVFIAREDMEGLDIQEGAKVRLYRAEAEAQGRDFVLQVGKKLRRRVVVIHPDDRAALGVVPTKTADVKPVEVPWLPKEERVFIHDVSSPAPGADAFRWFFYAASPPWTNTRHSLSNVRALQKEFSVKLRNVYSFFTIYANIDGYDPRDVSMKSGLAWSDRPELDRWMLGELARTTLRVTEFLDAYDVYSATGVLTEFVDALSNWYVRRSRARYWRSGWDADKASAYETLYASLETLTHLIAPFTPFAAERMYQNLVVLPAKRHGETVPQSVHLADYPKPELAHIDAALSAKMQAVRDIVSVGLKVRTDQKLKVRQPLAAAHIVLNNLDLQDGVAACDDMIKEELNVQRLQVVGFDQASRFGRYSYKPNFRTLGQRGLGKLAQELKKAWADPSPEKRKLLDAILLDGKGLYGDSELLREDIDASFETSEGFAAAGERVGVVVLETTLTDELRDLGLLREIQSRVQALRKQNGFEYTDRIVLGFKGEGHLLEVISRYRPELAAEVLATEIRDGVDFPGATLHDEDLDGAPVTIAIARA